MDPDGFLHHWIIGRFGMAIGEMFHDAPRRGLRERWRLRGTPRVGAPQHAGEDGESAECVGD
jgi:hypothetical protein